MSLTPGTGQLPRPRAGALDTGTHVSEARGHPSLLGEGVEAVVDDEPAAGSVA